MATYQSCHPVAFEFENAFCRQGWFGTDLTVLKILCDISITAHARTERFTCGLNWSMSSEFTEAM